MSKLGAPEFAWRPLQFGYDMARDVITIEGIDYAGGIFRKMSDGARFELYLRADDVLDVKPDA